MQLTLGMYGSGDFFTMKGILEALLSKVGLLGKITVAKAEPKPFLHPGRQADVYYCKVKLGYLGEIHPQVADHYGLGQKTYIAVLDMPVVVELATFDRKYTGIARYPAVTRDISMLVPGGVTAGAIESILLQRGGKILESVSLFDIYEGAQVKAGHKSMAYSLIFRASDRTLSDTDVSAAMKKIWNGLETLGIEIRS